MLLTVCDHDDVLTEAVNYGADELLMQAQPDADFLAAEHPEYFLRILGKIETAGRGIAFFIKLPHLAHSVHSEMRQTLAFICFSY